MIGAGGAVKHHTSLKRGYVSRKGDPQTYPYKGRFGEGYYTLSTNLDSTRYCYITYYVKQ